MFDSYDRRLQIEIGKGRDLFLESDAGFQIRVVFKIRLDWGARQSYADIAIYNLNRDTEARVFRRGEPVALRAGYANSQDYLFQGDIMFIQRERAGPDRLTRIFARGGSVAQQKSVIAETLGEGANLKQAISACAKALGYPVVIYGDELNVTLQKGHTMVGDPMKWLESLSRTHKFTFGFEGSKIVVLGDNSHRPGPAHKVSSLTGMEGSPEVTEVGVNVRTRLNPRVKIGQLLHIESLTPQANFSGVYFRDKLPENLPKTIGEGRHTVKKIEHEGDTHGDAWTSRFTCLSNQVNTQ